VLSLARCKKYALQIVY